MWLPSRLMCARTCITYVKILYMLNNSLLIPFCQEPIIKYRKKKKKVRVVVVLKLLLQLIIRTISYKVDFLRENVTNFPGTGSSGMLVWTNYQRILKNGNAFQFSHLWLNFLQKQRNFHKDGPFFLFNLGRLAYRTSQKGSSFKVYRYMRANQGRTEWWSLLGHLSLLTWALSHYFQF